MDVTVVRDYSGLMIRVIFYLESRQELKLGSYEAGERGGQRENVECQISNVEGRNSIDYLKIGLKGHMV